MLRCAPRKNRVTFTYKNSTEEIFSLSVRALFFLFCWSDILSTCVRVCARAHVVNPVLFSSTHLGLGAEQVRAGEVENYGILLGTLNLKMQPLTLYWNKSKIKCCGWNIFWHCSYNHRLKKRIENCNFPLRIRAFSFFSFTLVCHITLFISTYLKVTSIKFLSIWLYVHFLLKHGIKYGYRRRVLDINIRCVGGIGTLSRRGKMGKNGFWHPDSRKWWALRGRVELSFSHMFCPYLSNLVNAICLVKTIKWGGNWESIFETVKQFYFMFVSCSAVININDK